MATVHRRLTLLTVCAWALLGAAAAQGGSPAEVLTDATYVGPSGKTRTCYAPHRKTGETVPVKGIQVSIFWALSGALHDSVGQPTIVFNKSLLGRYPPIVALFAYYHECAHLSVPTTDEALANCEGLIAMRRAGDVTPALEDVLRDAHYSFTELDMRYGGSGQSLWDATVECAKLHLDAHR